MEIFPSVAKKQPTICQRGQWSVEAAAMMPVLDAFIKQPQPSQEPARLFFERPKLTSRFYCFTRGAMQKSYAVQQQTKLDKKIEKAVWRWYGGEDKAFTAQDLAMLIKDTEAHELSTWPEDTKPFHCIVRHALGAAKKNVVSLYVEILWKNTPHDIAYSPKYCVVLMGQATQVNAVPSPDDAGVNQGRIFKPYQKLPGNQFMQLDPQDKNLRPWQIESYETWQTKQAVV